MSALMRYKVNKIILILSDWSTNWCRTSQHYINNISIIYSNVIFYCTKVIIDDTIEEKVNLIESILIENLHKRNALYYLIF